MNKLHKALNTDLGKRFIPTYKSNPITPSLQRTDYTSFNNRVRELQSKLPLFQPDCGELAIIPLVALQGYTEPDNEWQNGFTDAITHIRKQCVKQSELSEYPCSVIGAPNLPHCSPPVLAAIGFHKERGFPIEVNDTELNMSRSMKFLLHDIMYLIPLGKIDKFGDILVKYGLSS